MDMWLLRSHLSLTCFSAQVLHLPNHFEAIQIDVDVETVPPFKFI